MRRDLAGDLDDARELITRGQVRVAGSVADNPTRQVAPGEPVVVVPPPPRFVSRAGFKLDGALDGFGVDPAGRSALDVGASTGGFTDCLLARGADHVWTVDVGTNQLHERLRADPRVTVHERTDVRRVARADLPDRTDLVSVDLSFISLVGLADHLVTLAGHRGELVVLVKPQFESTRREADIGSGVITDPEIWRRTLTEVAGAFQRAGSGIMGVMASQVRGTSGNTEFFLHARNGRSGQTPTRLEAMIDGVIDATASGEMR